MQVVNRCAEISQASLLPCSLDISMPRWGISGELIVLDLCAEADLEVLRASFLAGCLGFALSVIPFVLFAFGPRIRARVSGFLVPPSLDPRR